MEKINSPKFRKGRGFDPSKEVGKTISSKTKLYEVKEDYKKLPEKHQNKITGGIKLYNEPVISFTTVEDYPELFATFVEQIEKNGFFFLPLFESENFYQGLMYRPTEDTHIDAMWNRMFYANHCVSLFKAGYDPTLAGVADILYDMRTSLCINWDSRHRIVGQLAASAGEQMPSFGWNNALVIKPSAPTKGSNPVFANIVGCWLFERKNDSPKSLTPVERFVAEYRTESKSAVEVYSVLMQSRLKLGTDVLSDLEKLPDARSLSGLSQFRNDWNHENLGKGVWMSDASSSLKRAYTGAQVPEFSVFLILGYCHLLQLNNKYNGAWGYDNDVMIEALKWAYQMGIKPSNLITPRANGKPYETIAFHLLRLAYNPYCKEMGMDEKVLSYEHFGFDDAFLATIGVSKEEMKGEEVEEGSDTLDETFGIENIEKMYQA
tara:strand:+ start:95 stop:1396 length:1302 start_codon:yes stop_codon:yes gene_type:complete